MICFWLFGAAEHVAEPLCVPQNRRRIWLANTRTVHIPDQLTSCPPDCAVDKAILDLLPLPLPKLEEQVCFNTVIPGV